MARFKSVQDAIAHKPAPLNMGSDSHIAFIKAIRNRFPTLNLLQAKNLADHIADSVMEVSTKGE